jgi:hypothetical protein
MDNLEASVEDVANWCEKHLEDKRGVGDWHDLRGHAPSLRSFGNTPLRKDDPQEQGTLTEPLIEMVRQIVYHLKIKNDHREEVFSLSIVVLLKCFQEIDITQNVFNYLTTIILNEYYAYLNRETRERKIERSYYRSCQGSQFMGRNHNCLDGVYQLEQLP